MHRLKAVLLLLLLLATTACKSTLKLHSGENVAAKVESADRDYVYVVLEDPKSAWEAYSRPSYARARLGPEGQRGEKARLHRVPRAAIREVEPPGLTAAVVGTPFLEVGLTVIGVGFVEERGCGGVCEEFYYYAGIGGGIGLVALVTTITGWAIYASAAARARPVATLDVAPVVSFGDDDTLAGLATQLSW